MASTGKRKRLPSNSASSAGDGADASDPAGPSERTPTAGIGEEEDAAVREQKEVEEQEAALSVARPALIFCRLVDGFQSALKNSINGDDASDDGSVVVTSAAAAAAAAAAADSEEGTLELFLSGGDDFLMAAARAAHEAFESATKPLGRGGGVVEILEAMNLRDAFAGKVEQGDLLEGAGEKRLAAACRERVMDLLCDGELAAVASSRSSA